MATSLNLSLKNKYTFVAKKNSNESEKKMRVPFHMYPSALPSSFHFCSLPRKPSTKASSIRLPVMEFVNPESMCLSEQ